MTPTLTVVVNGEPRAVGVAATVADLLPADARGHAVALNGTVVPRADHTATRLSEGDVVEIVVAVQGG